MGIGRAGWEARESENAASRSHRRLASIAAGPLALVTPFAMFVAHGGYAFRKPEILLCLGGVAGTGLLVGTVAGAGGRLLRTIVLAGLLTLLVDFRTSWFRGWGAPLALVFVAFVAVGWWLYEHWPTIVSVFLAVLLAGVLLLPAGRTPQTRTAPSAAPPAGDAPPLLVHVVLDEQIGIEGIPRAFDPEGKVAAELLSFYLDNGFTVFGRAYSRYYDTEDSLSNLLNFTASPMPYETYGRRPRSVSHNAYFELLTRRGYRIHVDQTDYLDFCEAEGEIALARCSTYALETLGAIEEAPLAAREKARVAMAMFVRTSFLLTELRAAYRALRRALAERGLGLPAWDRAVGRVSPVAAMPVLDRLVREIPSAEPGSMFFVHLMLPHYPYAYDRYCHLRPATDEWLERHAGRGLQPMQNDWRSRAERYPRYLDQVLCTQRKLGALFDAMREAGVYEDATIVVHGDHGSRIVRHPPRARLEKQLTSWDYVDAFSTLFAIRVPGRAPVYDRRPLPIGVIFRQMVRGGRTAEAIEPPRSPEVRMKKQAGRMELRPMPTFANGETS